MAETLTHTISMAQFRQLFPVSECINIGDDVCVIDLRYDKNLEIIRHPCRLDGFMVFFCISGRLRMTINLTDFDVVEDSLFINFPGDILTVSEFDESQKDSLHFIVMALSRDYMSSLKVNMPQLMARSLALLNNPCFTLTGEEKSIAKKYLALATEILKSNLMYKRECIASLLSSLFYLDGGVIERRISDAEMAQSILKVDRSRVIFDRFIALVSEYHTQERGVAFYADKLCLTPKYLSKLVKSASGRSAPDWIDSYVMLEARNMLKYSDIPIKEIVSRLNFPNPSTFHKFFKAKIGMTPLQYRKM